jgi:hypothetical protein
MPQLPVRVITPHDGLDAFKYACSSILRDWSFTRQLAWRMFVRDTKAMFRGSFLCLSLAGGSFSCRDDCQGVPESFHMFASTPGRLPPEQSAVFDAKSSKLLSRLLPNMLAM